MKKLIVFFSIVFMFTSAACGLTGNFGYPVVTGSGKITTENRQVASFERVDICCGMELYLTQGETETLEIQADDNLMEEIITRVANGTLDIQYKRMNNTTYRPTQPVRVYLTATEIQAVSLSGGGYFESASIDSQVFDLNMSGGSDATIEGISGGDIDINISGGGEIKAGRIEGNQVVMNSSGGSDAQIKTMDTTSADFNNSGGGNLEIDSCNTDQLDLSLSGGSDAEVLALIAEKLVVDASGGGTIRVSGSAVEQEISLAGGSSFTAGDLESEHADFSSSGGGDSTIWVTETLSVQLTGDSDLAYYGQPQIFNPRLSGGSELNPLGGRE